MPTRPAPRCTYPGCTSKADYRGRCERHQDNWRRQSKHTQLINQNLWRKVRAQALRRDHNTCVNCGKPGNEVDHIREIADDGALYDLANCRTLCHACHLRKTLMMAARRRKLRKGHQSDVWTDAMNIWDRLGFAR